NAESGRMVGTWEGVFCEELALRRVLHLIHLSECLVPPRTTLRGAGLPPNISPSPSPQPEVITVSDKNPRGRFVWHELMTTDAEAAIKFYPSVTAWGVMPFDQDPTYRMWTVNGAPIG